MHLQSVHGCIYEPLGEGELANTDALTKDFICYGYTISRKTMNRALEYLDDYLEEITAPRMEGAVSTMVCPV